MRVLINLLAQLPFALVAMLALVAFILASGLVIALATSWLQLRIRWVRRAELRC